MTHALSIESGTFWYRIEDCRIAAPLNEFDEPMGSGRAEIREAEYRVVRETPKGVWLDLGLGDLRFVRRDARKRWACPTPEEALDSFRARKERQLRILRAQIDHVESALGRAELLLPARPRETGGRR